MKKRLIAVMLCMSMILACGCGSKKEEKKAEVKPGTESQSESEEQVTEEAKPEYPEIISDGKVKNYDAVALINDAAYELYSYSEPAAKSYAKAVNGFAKKNAGKLNVYDMVIPLGSGIVFPDNLKDEFKGTDQKKAMDSIFGMLGDDVNKVDIYNNLMTHRNEYIYFRTDHHWTALGAYYAYEELCKAKQIPANSIESYETQDFEGFLGSFYKDTNEAEVLKNNEDTITAYLPISKNTSMHVTATDGTEFDWKVIYDVSSYSAGLKYSTFVAGDNPYTVIKNDDITDGSSCIVVKESFGNALTPFLVDHYQTIYLVDYRYWKGNLSELADKTGATDVILLNNLSMIRNKYLVGQLQGILK